MGRRVLRVNGERVCIPRVRLVNRPWYVATVRCSCGIEETYYLEPKGKASGHYRNLGEAQRHGIPTEIEQGRFYGWSMVGKPTCCTCQAKQWSRTLRIIQRPRTPAEKEERKRILKARGLWSPGLEAKRTTRAKARELRERGAHDVDAHYAHLKRHGT